MRSLVAAVVLLGAGSAAAQTFAAGVHGGVNLVRISSDTSVNTEFVPKPVVGVQGEMTFAESWTLRAELEYSGKGGQVTTTMLASPTIDYSLSYVALPINVRYGLGAGLAEAYVFAGTTLAALVSANQHRDDTGADTDVKSHLSTFEITLDLGAGIGYRVSPKISATVEVRYSLGLNQVAGNDPALAVGSWKTNTIQIVGGLVYSFGAGKTEPTPTYATAN